MAHFEDEDDEDDDSEHNVKGNEVEEREQSAFLSGCRFGNGEAEGSAKLPLAKAYAGLRNIVAAMLASKVRTAAQCAYNLGRLRANVLTIRGQNGSESTVHSELRKIAQAAEVHCRATPEKTLSHFRRLSRAIMSTSRNGAGLKTRRLARKQ